MLLCRRWTVAINTTRYGSTLHREVLTLESTSSSSGPSAQSNGGAKANGGANRGPRRANAAKEAAKAVAAKTAAASKSGGSKRSGSTTVLVRFTGRNVRCNLPSDLCSVLAPLLAPSSSSDPSDSGGVGLSRRPPLVELRAETLMEDRRMPLGSEVPVELSVYLNDAHAFLNLVDDDAAEDDSRDLLGGKFDHFNKAKKSKKGRKGPGEAAWGLLRWAQYGDDLPYVPAKKEENEGEESDSANDESSEEEEKNPDEALADPAAEAEEENSPEWAKDLFNADADTAKGAPPPELPDPAGFKPNVTLRPYQRQALHWMSRRENDSQNSDVVKKELEFLSELHASSTGGGTAAERAPADRSIPFPRNEAGVSCDRGPVAVSPKLVEVGDGIPALNGMSDPKYVHPLWQRRYLAMDDAEGGKLYSPLAFYVNELLGTARASPPRPPRQCRGGILADAMGLGKTVMLLALVLQGKSDDDDGDGEDGGGRVADG